MHRNHRDQGFTLIEVLITIVLMAIGVTALLTGLLTASRSSASSRGFADARQVLLSTAERIGVATYAPCSGIAAGGAYAAARSAVTLPSNGGGNPATGVDVTRIDYWDGSVFGSSCTFDSDSASKGRMQRISLLVGSESVVFVKRAP